MADLKLPSVNYIIIAGRLTQDPDLRYTPRGTAVCTMRVAVTRWFRDKDTGELKDESSFFNVIAWNKWAELSGERLKKGSAVLIEGQIRSRNWETPTGEKRYTVEIIARRMQFLDKVSSETQEEEAEPEELDIPPEEF